MNNVCQCPLSKIKANKSHITNVMVKGQIQVMQTNCKGEDNCYICLTLKRLANPTRMDRIKKFIASHLKCYKPMAKVKAKNKKYNFKMSI